MSQCRVYENDCFPMILKQPNLSVFIIHFNLDPLCSINCFCNAKPVELAIKIITTVFTSLLYILFIFNTFCRCSTAHQLYNCKYHTCWISWIYISILICALICIYCVYNKLYDCLSLSHIYIYCICIFIYIVLHYFSGQSKSEY